MGSERNKEKCKFFTPKTLNHKVQKTSLIYSCA